MKTNTIILVLLLISSSVIAQEEEKKEAPKYSLFRATENYEYLKNEESNPYEKDAFDPIKFIPLNSKKNVYLSIGGQIRPRLEVFSNRFWEGEEDENFYSQRLALHSNLVLGKHIRVFGEFYHGYTSHEEEFVESDELNVHQAFIEFKFSVSEGDNLSMLFGRQELGFGAGRLVGFREGPNIRRSFDAARFVYAKEKTKLQAFYGKEVRPNFGAFDNDFSLFDSNASNPSLWGLYSQFKIKGLNGLNELYYLGFNSNQATFNDVTGEETRHSLGIRRFGRIGKRWRYNTALTYQFGDIGDSSIGAFNIDTDWHYDLINTAWKISPGLKLEYTSGDENIGDGKINSFSPLFVNPAFYSLAATITPVNIIAIHPSVGMWPTEKLHLYAEWNFFWRASENDGLYQPPRFIRRPANGLSERGLGNQLGFQASYEFNRHLSLDLDISYFIAGEFQEASGEAENIFHLAPTLSYKF
ncbi:alginate export family protein [uncultured Croceitalea sp.]|uniref:alginate export family protein n=1 Tax=uncultured Croceitalea sp. TaxID=1798908 RepID=UPI0033055D7B